MDSEVTSGFEFWCELPDGCVAKEIKEVNGRMYVRTEYAVYDVTTKGVCVLVGSEIMNSESKPATIN